MKLRGWAILLCCAMPSMVFLQESSELISAEAPMDGQPVEVDAGAAPQQYSECFETEAIEEECSSDFCFDHDPYRDPENRWYFVLKPGYYYLSDDNMRKFFDDGGFTMRGEVGCKFWGPLIVWVDGGYFQKTGAAIGKAAAALGGFERIDFKLATLTLGLKYLYDYNSCLGFYLGAGPRLFMMMMMNEYPHVSDDNAIAIGGGFDAGLWVFPLPSAPNLFLDLFADYSWKKIKIEPDEISSFDYDVNVSGLTFGLGLGVRF